MAPAKRRSLKKTNKSPIGGFFEWTGWKREPSQRDVFASPTPVKRESIRTNLPQEWLPGELDPSTKQQETSPARSSRRGKRDKVGVLMKKSDGLDPVAMLIKIIQSLWEDVFGFLTGFFHHK